MGQCIKAGKPFTSAEPLYKPVKCCHLRGFPICQTFLRALSTSSFGHFKSIIGGGGNTFTFSPWILQGAISLLKDPAVTFLHESLSLGEAAGHRPVPPPAPATPGQHPQPDPRNRGLPAANRPLCSGEQSSSPTPSVTGSFPGLPQRRDSLGRKGCDPRGLLGRGAGIPPAPATAGSTKPDPSLIHAGAPMAPEPLTLLFISVAFLGRLRTALWALVSLLVFPCNALLCLIFKPDHHFLFSLCFSTQGLDSRTRDWLCSTALPYPRPNFPASVVPHASERESEILTDTFPSLTSSASGCLLETPS